MQFAQFGNVFIVNFNFGIFEELVEHIFSELLSFLALSSQDSLYLSLAFAVVAKLTQSGCTFCDFDVSISTWSPLCSLWLKGTNLWLTFATDTVASKECVYRESKIQCRTVLWHGLDFTFRG